MRRAVSQGTLRGTRSAPRALQLSPSEKRYIRRSWPLLATLRAILRTEQNVRFALLFGSAARGTDTPASDIDMLVEMRDSSLERMIDRAGRRTLPPTDARPGGTDDNRARVTAAMTVIAGSSALALYWLLVTARYSPLL